MSILTQISLLHWLNEDVVYLHLKFPSLHDASTVILWSLCSMLVNLILCSYSCSLNRKDRWWFKVAGNIVFICRHSLFQVAQAITPNIVMYLPRNVDMPQAIELSWLSSPPLDVEVYLFVCVWILVCVNESWSHLLLLLSGGRKFCAGKVEGNNHIFWWHRKLVALIFQICFIEFSTCISFNLCGQAHLVSWLLPLDSWICA